jgi:PAS domain S-box-containing protein
VPSDCSAQNELESAGVSGDEHTVSENAERLHLALEAGRLGDWSWTAATDVIVLSDRAASIFGLPLGQPITWTQMRELLHEEHRERARLAVETALGTRTDYDIVYRVARPSGGDCWIAARGRGTYAEDGTIVGMIGVVQDISERKAVEDELRQVLESERAARSQAERLSAIKDEFLAVLSHELRTPLSAILGWAQIMRHRVGSKKTDTASVEKANEDMIKGLDVIERNARMQTQLIDDLLDMSRISSGKMRLELHAVMPSVFIEAAVEMVRPAAAAKDVRIELTLDREIGPVAGDASRLQQVVWNLLSNAIKFTPRGGRVEVRLDRGPAHVEINVIDSGTGIRADFLEYVFDRFRQGDASTTRKHGGLGLGLSIVKQLVEAHGGSARATSPGEGLGSTFTVVLPFSSDGPTVATTAAAQSAPPPPVTFKSLDLAGVAVVVVDDEPDARALIARVLQECGARVSVASRAEEALALIDERLPDVLVSDIGMPDMDGFELLRRVRALPAERGGQLPVIALTAFAREEDRTRSLEAGFSMHLTKPIELPVLVASVAQLSGRESSEAS